MLSRQSVLDRLVHCAWRRRRRWHSRAMCSGACEAPEASELPKGLLLYEELKKCVSATKRIYHYSKEDKELVSKRVEEFLRQQRVLTSVGEKWLPRELAPSALSRFRKLVLRAALPKIKDLAKSCEQGASLHSHLWPVLTHYLTIDWSEQVKAYRELIASSDLRTPKDWYPVARLMKRKIVFHAGPTNSGKTYQSLQRLLSAKSGVYCAPLRLLAHEVYDKANCQGTLCDLATGQELIEIPGATHTACTIEITNIDRIIEVGVIDEIQMIADESRGWAWTRALMGLPADELHVCGDSAAIPIVTRIAQLLGEEVEIHDHERLKPLHVLEKPLKDVTQAEAGDAVLAFSRSAIMTNKRKIEDSISQRVALIYGALPPRARAQQAQLFNRKDSGYDVLVASDAIAMGLNLNIRRIVFTTTEKYTKEHAMEPLSIAMVKQIAGRAGRMASPYPEGLVAATSEADIKYIKRCLASPTPSVRAAGLFPPLEQILLFAARSPTHTFPMILKQFAEKAAVETDLFFLCNFRETLISAQNLERVPDLSLEDRYTLSIAPVAWNKHHVGRSLLRFADSIARGGPVLLGIDLPLAARQYLALYNQVQEEEENGNREFAAKPIGEQENDALQFAGSVLPLQKLEDGFQIASLYCWLSFRFDEELFPMQEEAQELAGLFSDLIEAALTSRRTSGALPLLQEERQKLRRNPRSQTSRHMLASILKRP